MRVSTAQIFEQGIAAIQRGQASTSRTQEQLSSGKKMLSPSDNPTGAVQALELRQRLDALDQYNRNIDNLTGRLKLEEVTLDGVRDGLQRVRELAIQANNDTQSNETRASIAGEIRQLGNELLDLGNTRDANGEYLFAGMQSNTRPFARGADGQTTYSGDTGGRRVSISADRSIDVGHHGELLMAMPSGNGTFSAEPDAGNTGTGVLNVAAVVDAGAYDAGEYRVEFDDVGEYSVLDADDNEIATGEFSAGAAIRFSGVEIALQGTPADGDVFHVRPSEARSLFETYDRLAATLETPTGTPAERAALHNGVAGALAELDGAHSELLAAQGEVGARLQTTESQKGINEYAGLQMNTTLSGVEDLDYAEAISRFSVQLTGLQAAQQTYVQMSRLSLFDLLR